MTAFQWFTVVQTVATLFLSVVLGAMFRGFSTGRWVQTRVDDVEKLGTRITSLEKRMDQAGEKLSDFETQVQALPETLRVMFVPRELFMQGNMQNNDNYTSVRREIERLWDAVRNPRGNRA